MLLYYFLLMYMMQYYWKSSVETGITEKHENSQSLQDKIVQERNNLRNKQKIGVCHQNSKIEPAY